MIQSILERLFKYKNGMKWVSIYKYKNKHSWYNSLKVGYWMADLGNRVIKKMFLIHKNSVPIFKYTFKN